MKTLKEEELKTLEGIGKITKSGAFVCNFKELKQEIIKWIKKSYKDYEIYNNRDMDAGIVVWIKHFFNITDEDLK